MKSLLASTCLIGAALAFAPAAVAAECGSVTIASMNWQSAEVLSALDKIILEEGYGCEAEVTVGDTVPTITSMVEKGQPDIAPEGWVDLLPEVVNRGVEEGKLVVTGDALSDGGVQGWWVPKYIVDAHPDIKTIDDVLKHPELFPDPEDASKGTIVNGPQGWGGTVVTSQLYKAYGAEAAGFTLLDSGSSAGLDGSIAKAFERKEGWVGYYWAPTALLGKYEMVKLEHGVPADPAEWKRCNTVADCADPKKNDWPKDKVATIVTKSFADRAGPEVMDYLSKRSWGNDTVNKLMAWMTDNQATGEAGAKHFLTENADVWTAWVSPEAAEKIKASL
ncbi:ABC transporter substrate-binding protein [Methylobrevis pamukkalensis]|uniref:Substrate binding domain of ABC-type glycine betaine transport system n=1 Tax=Methylobrevis pamukkalensis TaxID=1439726 RepID=A0A1E3H3F2_9HYPH|nr:ABC transporter substrate-binding protein [Methylobrevis pamukkalensis]ODN70853.1 Substrate binding domain of ABC-type glycine betaine transport system [Methylobrevis pamukkalensis]